MTVPRAQVTLPQFADPQQLVGDAIIIASGTGAGEMNIVVGASVNEQGTYVDVASPWTVQPDSTSEFLIQTTFYNSVIYNNTVTYDSTYGPNLSGSAGIQLSGGYGVVIDENTTDGGDAGIVLSDEQFQPIDGSYPLYAPSMNFIQVIGNTDTYSAAAGIEIRQNSSATLVQENTALLGTILSGNLISGVIAGYEGDGYVNGQGISLGWAGPGDDTELIVIEHNNISDCEVDGVSYDIGLYDDAPNVLVYDNTFADSSDPNVPFKGEPDATADFVSNNNT